MAIAAAALVGIGFELFKGAPEVIDMLASMRANGQTEPTQEQKDALTAAFKERGIEDFTWDNFGK